MSSTTQRPADTFEIVYNPAEGTAFVYRSIYAGICGPMTTAVPVADQRGAEDEALRHGLVRSGPWTSARTGYDYATAERHRRAHHLLIPCCR